MFQGVGNFGLWMFSRGCGTRHRGCGTRSRALTCGFLIEKRLLTPSPDVGRGKVAKDAKFRLRSGQVRGRAEVLVRYGESGLRGATKPTTGLVANIADR